MSSEAGCLIPSPERYHSLATSTYSLSTAGSGVAGSTTIAPYMPFAMCARTGLVPQWYMKTPGSPALKRKVKDSPGITRSEEHTSELQSRLHLVCRLLLEKKKKKTRGHRNG